MKLKVAVFASGSPLSRMVLQRVAKEHRLAGVLMPRPRLLDRIRHRIVEDVGQPDVIVVGSYPRIIPIEVLRRARIGALNVHMSLLPRHRGVDPIFGTYWSDDREAGVTVHWMDAGTDTGPIAAQERMPLPRGLASRELYFELARRGVDLLSNVLATLPAGTPQDQSLATHLSAADIAAARVPFAEWPSERVWHVLSGLGDQRHGLIDGMEHGRALSFREGPSQPGRIDGNELHCADGVVSVEVPPPRRHTAGEGAGGSTEAATRPR